MTQPALTKAVQKLEQELGGALIYRERHLSQLTELGKMILPTLEKIFAAAEAVRLQARGYQKKTIAPLKIGLVPSVSAALITELLLELARIIPDLRVRSARGGCRQARCDAFRWRDQCRTRR